MTRRSPKDDQGYWEEIWMRRRKEALNAVTEAVHAAALANARQATQAPSGDTAVAPALAEAVTAPVGGGSGGGE